MNDDMFDKKTSGMLAVFSAACFFMAVVLIAIVVLSCVKMYLFACDGSDKASNVVIALLGVGGWIFSLIVFPTLCAAEIVGIILFIYYGYSILKTRRRAISESLNEIKQAAEKTAAVALANVLFAFFIIWFIYNDILCLIVLGVIPLTFGIAFLVLDILCAKRLKKIGIKYKPPV